MNNLLKVILAIVMIGVLAIIIKNNDLERIVKLIIFYFGIKEIPKILF